MEAVVPTQLLPPDFKNDIIEAGPEVKDGEEQQQTVKLVEMPEDEIEASSIGEPPLQEPFPPPKVNPVQNAKNEALNKQINEMKAKAEDLKATMDATNRTISTRKERNRLSELKEQYDKLMQKIENSEKKLK